MNRLAREVAPIFGFDRAPMPSQWLEENIRIPRQMSPRSPGPVSFRNMPWAREIVDCAHPESGVRKLDLAVALQVFKTTGGCFIVGYRQVFEPMPTMIVGGMSENFARREISRKRMHPLINANEVLSRLKPHDKHKFGELEMSMAFAPILVTGAGSDTNLAGSTQGIVWVDECSKIIHTGSEQAAESHPIRLAEDRTSDYEGIEFILKTSTPNTPNHLFWQDVESGTFRHFYVPCPHCGEYFKFEFEATNGDKKLTPGELDKTVSEASPDIYRSIVWDADARNKDGTWDQQKVIETAHYVCPHCGGPITDADKPKMLEAYEGKNLNENAANEHRSYRVPCFYKVGRTFGGFAWKFLDRGDLLNTGLQVLYNHELALPWEDIDVNVKDQEIWDCIATGDIAYQRGMVPRVPGRLFVGADWGEKETHWVVGLIDPEDNVWVVDWGTVDGLQTLGQERKQWIYHRAGHSRKKMTPVFGFLDSGDNTAAIYKFCKQSRFFLPSKGSDAQSGEWHQTTLKNYEGLPLYVFVDKVAKDDLYESRIKMKRERKLFLPANTTVDLIAGMSGQKRLDKGANAKWKKVKNDHYGDAIKNLVVISWVLSRDRFLAENSGD